MRGVIVLLTAATVSSRALEVLTSLSRSLSLWIIPSGCTAPGTGTAEAKEIVISQSTRCKMSALSHSPLLDK